MRRRFAVFLLAAGAACARSTAVPTLAPETAPYDLVIEGGRLVDGTGAAWVWGDLAIRGDRIVRIAPRGVLGREPARARLSAAGLVVAPGFIDIQGQSDAELTVGDGRVISKITQGITTEVVGNCGFSPAPVRPQTLELLKEYTGFLNPHLPWNWQRLGEFYQRVSERGCAMNIAPLVGHGHPVRARHRHGHDLRAQAVGCGVGLGPAPDDHLHSPADLRGIFRIARRLLRPGTFGGDFRCIRDFRVRHRAVPHLDFAAPAAGCARSTASSRAVLPAAGQRGLRGG